MKAKVYSVNASSGEVTLPKEYSANVNMGLLAQAIHVLKDLKHPGTSKVKTRSEINRTTKKVYAQKGTGGARHGSRRAPIFVGGGVTHGPKGVKRKLSLPKNLKKHALNSALSYLANEGKVVAVKCLDIKRTKDAQIIISKIFEDKKTKKVTVVLTKENGQAIRYFRNIAGVKVLITDMLNAHNVLFAGVLAFDSLNFMAPKAKTTAKKVAGKVIKKTKAKVTTKVKK